MRRLTMTIALIGIVAEAVLAQEYKPIQDPTKFSPWRSYAPDFAPPLGAVYRSQSANFVLDGPKKTGLADYRWFDGRHFHDRLQFDPSCSTVIDEGGAGTADDGYLYRVPNEPFWFFFADEGFDLPGTDAPRFRVYYSQNGKTFSRYSTVGGTTRSPLPRPGSGSPDAARAYIPSRLRLSIGGFLGTSYSVTLHESSLVYRVVPASPDSPTTVKLIVPTAEQWRAFRRAMNELRVWQWRREYPNPANIADGTSWFARIEYPGTALIAQGRNNYPGGCAAEPEMLGVPSEAFRRYLAAVQALLGGEAFR